MTRIILFTVLLFFAYLVILDILYLITPFIPPIILLPGLKKAERKQVINAWRDISSRYQLLKKMQLGITTSIKVSLDIEHYGKSVQSRASFNALKFVAVLGINKSVADGVFFIEDYYDYTIHEVTHTLTKILIPSFHDHFLFTTGETIEHTDSLSAFIDGVMNKHSISPEDIDTYVSKYAAYSDNWGEVLSECMWKYMKFMKNPDEIEGHPNTYRIVNAFISEFDQIYWTKVKK